jgi:hypothetical protein
MVHPVSLERLSSLISGVLPTVPTKPSRMRPTSTVATLLSPLNGALAVRIALLTIEAIFGANDECDAD